VHRITPSRCYKSWSIDTIRGSRMTRVRGSHTVSQPTPPDPNDPTGSRPEPLDLRPTSTSSPAPHPASGDNAAQNSELLVKILGAGFGFDTSDIKHQTLIRIKRQKPTAHGCSTLTNPPLHPPPLPHHTAPYLISSLCPLCPISPTTPHRALPLIPTRDATIRDRQLFSRGDAPCREKPCRYTDSKGRGSVDSASDARSTVSAVRARGRRWTTTVSIKPPPRLQGVA
jgi:hypothetical protein